LSPNDTVSKRYVISSILQNTDYTSLALLKSGVALFDDYRLQ